MSVGSARLEAVTSELERNSVLPLHEQLRNTLSLEIAAGAFGDQGRLPSEAELCERFGVSRISVRRAISDLVDQGLLVRRQGVGTFVNARPEMVGTINVVGIADKLSGGGKTSRQIKISRLEPATPELAAALGIAEGEDVFRLVRVFSSDGTPVSLDDTCFSAQRYPGLISLVTDEMSTYALLRSQYGVRFKTVDRFFGVTFTTPDTAEWLELPVRDPLVLIDKVATDVDEQVIHVSTVQAVPGRVEILTTASMA